MDIAAGIVRNLIGKGVYLHLEQDALKYKAQRGVLSEQDKQDVRVHKDAIIAYLRQVAAEKSNHDFHVPPIEVGSRPARIPLSFAQQRLWFIDQLGEGSSQYNISGHLSYEAPLQLQAFEQALACLLERHEILRTQIVVTEQEPYQVIAQDFQLPYQFFDLSALTETEKKHRLTSIAKASSDKPFDLTKDLVIRVALAKLDEHSYVIIFTVHHIALDGWSLAVLKQELRLLIHTFSAGNSNPLPALRLQYADYALWQKRWLSGDVLRQQLDYWQKTLAGIPPVHSVHLDKPRPQRQQFNGMSCTAIVSAETTRKISSLCIKHDVTMFMFLQTAFSLLLARYSRNRDIVMGTHVAGRLHLNEDALIGNLVNTLVLRNQLHDLSVSFPSALSTNKQTILDAYKHQYVPFDMVVEALKPERSLSYEPVVQIVFALHNEAEKVVSKKASADRQSKPQTQNGHQTETEQSARFDIGLHVFCTEDEIQCSWRFNKEIFHKDTMLNMSRNFVTLLDGICQDEHAALKDLPILAEQEKTKLLDDFNCSSMQPETEVIILRQIEEQARKHPENIALISNGATLTYGQMDARANQLAHYLIAQGVTAGSFVGVCFHRSNDMMISILAVLKTGAAYVPIDAGYPMERVGHMLADAKAQFVISQDAALPVLLSQSAATVINLDNAEVLTALNACSQNIPVLPKEPVLSDLMYLLYTSGSSGRPKGVLTPHGGVLDYCRSGIEQYYHDWVTGSLVVTSLSFGVTVPGLFIPLMQGQSVELVSDVEVLGAMWQKLFTSNRSYFIRMTPSHISSLLAYRDQFAPSAQRHVFVIGGEKFSLSQFELLRAGFPAAKIYNHYGSTEAIVGCFCFDTDALSETVATEQSIPAGKPLNYSKAFILDDDGQLLPVGAAGELHIYRSHPTQGYINDAQLTAQKYVDCPFVRQTAGRDSKPKMFKMGDIARWRHDGQLEILGRLDDQVNIRGHRIELGEVESKLYGCAGVKQAVACVHQDGQQHEYLVAYVTATDSVMLNTQEIRRQLAETLPDFMIPGFIEVLPAIPLTHNGKINKKALPAPNIAGAVESSYVAPRNPLEAELCKLWQQTLNLEKIGIFDNFFSLGGHSLLGTRLINLIRQQFDTELPIKALFEAPTVAGLSERICERADIFTLPPIVKADRSADLPLSYAQQRLWFIDQLEQNSVQYNMSGRYMMAGDFKLAAFEQAMTSLIDRHEVLRTYFQTVNGEPQQIICQHYDLPVTFFDFSTSTEQEQNKAVAELVQEEANKAFDLSQDLMIRAVVVKLRNDAHLILYTLHHIASDGWSLTIFKRELSALYRAYCAGQANPLQPLTYQYSDYAMWQKSWLQGEVLEEHLRYWKTQLTPIPVVHSLPLDKRRPAHQTYQGKARRSLISQKTANEVALLCQQHQVTLFMFLQTAFTVLLSRYSHQTDIVVGTPVAGRTHKDVEDLIGFFVNSLVLYTDLSDNPRFSDLLQQNKQMILEAYAHQHMPFEMLVEAISPQRDMSHNSLFQIVFSIQDHDTHTPATAGDSGQSAQFRKDSTLTGISTRVDLEVRVRAKADSLSMVWIYNDALFEDSTILRLANHYSVLLDSIVASLSSAALPEPTIGELTILTEEELQKIRQLSGGDIKNESELFRHGNLVQTLRENAGRYHHETAVIYEGERLSYGELNLRANRLAHLLRHKGVQQGDRVPLYFNRSIDMVIAVLAVLQTGAAYIPLEPAHPASRIADILQDSAARLVLTHQALIQQLPETTLLVVCADSTELFNSLPAQPTTELQIEIKADDLAYIIYTSGSTGAPKGVMVSHGNLMHYLSHGVGYLPDGITGSIVSSTLAFDATVCSFFIPLMLGKSIELLPDSDDLLDQLIEYISDDDDSFLFKLTPAHLQALLNCDFLSANAHARHVFVIGGEQLSTALVRAWQQLLPGSTFINEYGPTEATVGCSVFRYDASHAELQDNVAIGRPIANTQMYVLNSQLNLQPIGVTGELYIGGQGLTRGYLDLPALSAEKFLPNPFSHHQEQRLYRTGDLAKLRADGQFEYIGRIDQQVKIRGFRIELPEIEVRLMSQPWVSEAVVLAKQDKRFRQTEATFQHRNDLQLVAYLVLSAKSKSGVLDEVQLKRQLKAELQQHLPDYMVPEHFIVLDTLPLTAQGKIDKKALPEPEQDGHILGEYAAPRNETEAKLCALWQDILKVDKVGIEDNFFTLGGHSLLATRLISAMRQSFAVELPLRTMFEFPTIASISAKLQGQSEAFLLPDILCGVADAPAPLSYAQQRLWFIDRLNHGSPQYNMVGVFLIDEAVDVPVFDQALASLLDRHHILRTYFQEFNNETQQVLKSDARVTSVLHDLTALSHDQKGQRISSLAKQEAAKTFDLTNDVLLRVHLLKLTDNMQMVMYVTHHVASDGWSTAILKQELTSLYFRYKDRQHYEDNPLPPLPVQYADYAQWQRRWLSGDVLERQLNYWRNRLAGAPPVHSIPLDKPRPAKQTYAGNICRHVLNPAMTSQIYQLCGEQQTTLFIFLQTAFAVLMGRYSNAEDIVIGSAISGRNHKKLEGLIGFFVNALALRTDLSGKPTFSQLLQENKRHILDAYTHQHVPFEMLVETLRPERNLSYNPLYQVMFAVQQEEQFELQDRHQLALSDEERNAVKHIQQYLSSATTTRCDLLVQVTERGNTLTVNWLFNEALFDESTIKRLGTFYETLLLSIIEDLSVAGHSDRTIDQLQMMTPEAVQQLFLATHGHQAEPYEDVCLHERIEMQAKLTPHRIAVSSVDYEISYQELNEKSNKLARYLLRTGVRPDSAVALCFEPSVEMMISIVAVLKAGGAYLPLAPNMPSVRMQKILADADVAIVLTQVHLMAELSVGDRRVLPLDESFFEILLAHFDSSDIPRTENLVTDANLAYIIYTSGSTGEAKGVMVPHRAVSQYCNNALTHYYPKACDGSLLITSYSVDMTVPGLFVPLFCGHKVQLLADGIVLEKLASHLLKTQEHYLLRLTPSHIEGLLTLLPDGTMLSNQHAFVIGGEVLHQGTIERLRKVFTSSTVFNHYGPTEVTVGCVINTAPYENSLATVPIGKAMNGIELYVLNDDLALHLPGSVGELAISTNRLARGYMNNQMLTDDKFISNPYSDQSTARMYRTGDLVRWLPDGQLMYIGRRDEQIQMRGFRVELGEVVAALKGLDSVVDATAIVVELQNNNECLTAYIVPEQPFEAEDELELQQEKNRRIRQYRAKLTQLVPEHFIPSIFVFVEQLPMTANGKINKRALPQPSAADLQSEAYQAPETETESTLCQLWQEILRLDKIGTRDNFFMLGGHSLLATRFVSLVRGKFNIELPLKSVFDFPTISELSNLVDSQLQNNNELAAAEKEEFVL